MCLAREQPIILCMTRPVTASKVVLVADRRGAPASHEPNPVRRYRLERLRSEPRLSGAESRFEYLKRVYD